MPDCLLHQPAQPRLQAVVGPLLGGEPVFGPAIPDRRMPVLARLGQAPKPPVDNGGHATGAQHPLQPCQLDQLCSWQHPGQPHRITTGRPRWSTLRHPGRCGCGAWRHTAPSGCPPPGSLHPGPQPVQAHRLTGCDHLRKVLTQLGQAGDEAAVGLAVAQGGQRTARCAGLQVSGDAPPRAPAPRPSRRPEPGTWRGGLPAGRDQGRRPRPRDHHQRLEDRRERAPDHRSARQQPDVSCARGPSQMQVPAAGLGKHKAGAPLLTGPLPVGACVRLRPEGAPGRRAIAEGGGHTQRPALPIRRPPSRSRRW